MRHNRLDPYSALVVLLKRGNKSCPELMGRVCGERIAPKRMGHCGEFIYWREHTRTHKKADQQARRSEIYPRVLLEKARAPPRPFFCSLILQQILSGRRASWCSGALSRIAPADPDRRWCFWDPSSPFGETWLMRAWKRAPLELITESKSNF